MHFYIPKYMRELCFASFGLCTLMSSRARDMDRYRRVFKKSSSILGTRRCPVSIVFNGGLCCFLSSRAG